VKGIDVWNPVDQTSVTIVEEMPMEIGHSNPHQRGKMISINGNTELVFLGGWSDIFITEIWKYKYTKNSWELLGNMQIGRENNLAIQVTGMECP